MSGSGTNLMIYYREAIQKNMETIAEYIRVDEILSAMFSSYIISQEEYQIIGNEGRTRGSIRQATLLLETIMNKETKQMEEFVEILREKDSEMIADLIDDTMKKMWNGEIRSNKTSLK